MPGCGRAASLLAGSKLCCSTVGFVTTLIAEHDLVARFAQPRLVTAQAADDFADIRDVAAAKPKHVGPASVLLLHRALREGLTIAADHNRNQRSTNQSSQIPVHFYLLCECVVLHAPKWVRFAPPPGCGNAVLDHLVGKQRRNERDADQAAKKDRVGQALDVNAQAHSIRPADRQIRRIALAGNVTATSAAYSSTCDTPCLVEASFTNPVRVVHTPIIVPDTGRMCDERLSLRVRMAIRLDMALA